ncbi:MAG: HAD family phosphatase [Nanoarchaeota archaeon]
MIKALAVDFGGVYFSWNWEEYWKGLEEITGVDKESLKRLPSRIWEYQVNKISNKEFWDHFCKGVGKQIPHEILNTFVENQFKPIPHVIEHLKKCKEKHQLVLFANQTEMLDRLNEKHAFYDNFHHIISSFKVGVQKPDKAMFDLLLQRTGEEAQNILLIDDTLTNVEAARNLGFQALLFSKDTDLEKELIQRAEQT